MFIVLTLLNLFHLIFSQTVSSLQEHAKYYGRPERYGEFRYSGTDYGSEFYPHYQERFLHHQQNQIRIGCSSWVTDYNQMSDIETIICPFFDIPIRPVWQHPKLVQVARDQCLDLLTHPEDCDSYAEGSITLQHETCIEGQDESPGARVSRYFINFSGENGAYHSLSGTYGSLNGRWLCEGQSNCHIGGHTNAIMREGSTFVGCGVWAIGVEYSFCDWSSSTEIMSDEEYPIKSGIWMDYDDKVRFMAAFYDQGVENTDGIKGFVLINGVTHKMQLEYGEKDFGTWIVDIDLTKNCQEYYFKFTYPISQGQEKTFTYPNEGSLLLSKDDSKEFTCDNGDYSPYQNSPETLLILILTMIALGIIIIIAISTACFLILYFGVYKMKSINKQNAKVNNKPKFRFRK